MRQPAEAPAPCPDLATSTAVNRERPLRIALYHDLPSGGAKRTVHAQVSELVRRGHRVDCYVTSAAEEEFLPLRDVADRVHVIDVPEPPDRERTLAGRPAPGDLLRWVGLYRAIRRAGRTATRLVDDDEHDILLAHPSQFTQAPHVLRGGRTPTVYYCHEVLRAAYDPLISPPAVRFAIRHTLGRVDRRNARAATAIAVNSAYTARRVREVYGRSAVVAAPGVDIQTFRPADQPRGDYLLAVGALHPLKGMDFIVRSVSRLAGALRPRLIIVADRARERERHRIEEEARAAGVALEIRQRVPEAELVRLYGRARAVLVAAHREPLGLVPLEAMACGTPVVAVADGGVPETVVNGATGYLVPRDPTRFADRVRHLLERPADGDALGRRGRAHVEEHWTWQRATEELLRLLRATIEAP